MISYTVNEQTYRPLMDENQSRLVDDYTQNKKNILEWGMGGSTFCYSQNVEQYYTIEHSQEWYNKYLPVLPANVTALLRTPECGFVPPKVGPGVPALQQAYINAVSEFNVESFDVILIDGRCRVDCAYKAKNYMHENSLLIIHDYERPRYKPIELFLKLVDVNVGDGRHLAVFKL